MILEEPVYYKSYKENFAPKDYFQAFLPNKHPKLLKIARKYINSSLKGASQDANQKRKQKEQLNSKYNEYKQKKLRVV